MLAVHDLHRPAVAAPVEPLHLVDHDGGRLVFPVPAFCVNFDDEQNVAIQPEELRADRSSALLVVSLERNRSSPGALQLGDFTGRDTPEETMSLVAAILIDIVCPNTWRDLKQVAVSAHHLDVPDRICGQTPFGEDVGDEREFPNHLCELLLIHD